MHDPSTIQPTLFAASGTLFAMAVAGTWHLMHAWRQERRYVPQHMKGRQA